MRIRTLFLSVLLLAMYLLVEHRSAFAQSRTFTFVNKCNETVWVGSLGNPGSTPPNGGGWALGAGQTSSVVLNQGWAGRFWGRRNCSFDGAGNGTCDTGDCGRLQCNGRGGAPPTSLAEFTLNGGGNTDFYDISLVDGYDFPMSIVPTPATTVPGNPYQCGSPGCTSDLLATCPGPLQKKNAAGRVVACMSACEAFNTDQYCCRGAFNTPATCKSSTWPVNYPAFFKAACPTAYSYAYDDTSSTYTCNNPNPNYTITFCPSGGSNPPPPPPGGINPSAWYQIIGQNSGKCADADNWGTANGTHVIQWPCGGGQANQQWQIVPTDSGYYKILSRNASWLAMDVTEVSAANSAKIQLWGYGGGANQQWRPESLGGGYYRFVSRFSGKCLDVPGNSTANAVQLQQYDCNGTSAQAFKLVQQ